MKDSLRKFWASRWRWPVVIGVVLTMLVGISLGVRRARSNGANDVPLYTVTRGPITISMTESGAIQSREKEIVRNQVEGRSTVIWVCEEGKMVTTNDLLIELDASRFTTQRSEQQIVVENAEAALLQSHEKLAIVSNEADSAVQAAEMKFKFANLDRTKYDQGEYPAARQQAEADLTMAREEQKRAADKLDWSRKLERDGFITRSEMEADELELTRRQLTVASTQSKLDVLNRFEYPQKKEQLVSDVYQAEMTLKRERRKAAANLIQAESEERAKQSEFERQKTRMEKVEFQIAHCRIYAPTNGMAVYASTVRASRRGGGDPLQAGQDIWEHQELIYIPASGDMVATVKFQEASLTKLRKGLPARIRVDALPNSLFHGRLSKIGVMPDSANAWMNPDLKLYECEFEIDDEIDTLRPGMSCQDEVLVAEYEDAVFVPVQCVVQVRDVPTLFVATALGTQQRAVDLGLDNNRMVRVLKGVQPGETVLLAPPLETASVSREGGSSNAPPSAAGGKP